MRDIETLNIESLHPKLKSVAHKLVAECEKHGLPIGVNAARRLEGIFFYRKDNEPPYSNEDGFFDKVGKIGKGLGLEWGADIKYIYSPAFFRLPKDGGGNA